MPRVHGDTTWREVYDGLTYAEKDCIRAAVDEKVLEAALGMYVVSDSSEGLDWEKAVFSCVAAETARAITYDAIVVSMEEEGLTVGEWEGTCLQEWVADADVEILLDSEGMETAAGIMACMPEIFVMLFLEDEELTLPLSKREKACLRAWASDTDWTVLAAMDEYSYSNSSLMGEAMAGFAGCIPRVILASMSEELGMDLPEPNEEQNACLMEWAVDVDWAALLGWEAEGLAGLAMITEATLGATRCVAG